MAGETLSACVAEIKANIGRYYVYVLSRPDGAPFYVGCGVARRRSRQRIEAHEMEAATAARSHKLAIIRKVLGSGRRIEYAIDSWHFEPASMFAREVALIDEIGRADKARGPLTNQNDGGTGQINPSAETRKKYSESSRLNMLRLHADPEFGRRASRLAAEARARRAVDDPLYRERRREVGRRVMAQMPVETKRRGAAAYIGRIQVDPELRAKVRKAQSETGKKNIAALQRWHASLNDKERRALLDRMREQKIAARVAERHSAWLTARNAQRQTVIARCAALVSELEIALPDGRKGLPFWLEFENSLKSRGAVD